ncbi:MAG: hypothetical protein Q9214_003575 [Letrouitia sp. 1 TL-2023]
MILTGNPTSGGIPGIPHHRNFLELQSCSACAFCQRVSADVASSTTLNNGRWQDQQVYLRIFSPSTSMDESEKTNMLVYCSPWQRENGRDQTYLATYGLYLDCTEFEIKEGKPDPRLEGSTLVNGRPIALSSDSEECFWLAKLWLEQCVKAIGHHDPKRRGIDAYAEVNLAASDYVELRSFRAPSRDLMSSRTVDVGVVDGSIEPRLVCHANRGDDGLRENWATLSYCWGGSAPLKSTMATISRWQEGIPLDQMPSTFRDAVYITRRLGLRHLWINSLCIIQDSPEDWESEATRMGKIYRYGLLNIAAETARTCHDVDKGHMFIRSRSLDVSWDDFLGPSASTLNSRGWVLQESFLLPRTLHYGKNHMFWECSHCTLSEISISPLIDANAGGAWTATTWFSSKMILPRAMNSLQSLNQVVPENDSRITSSPSILTILRPCWHSIHLPGVPEITVNKTLIPPVLVGGLTARTLHAETYLNDGDVTPADHFLDISGGKLELEGYLLNESCSRGPLGYESCRWLESIEGDGATPNKVRQRTCSCHFDVADERSNQSYDAAILHLGAWEWRYGLTFRSNRIETELAGLLLRPADSRPHIYRRVGIAKLMVGIKLNGGIYRFLEDAERLIAKKGAKAVVTVV